jgi:glucose/arabinose dehydrogenase
VDGGIHLAGAWVRPGLATALVVAALALGLSQARAGTPPIGNGNGGVDAEPVTGAEFNNPIYVTTPPGQSDPLYVVERGGTVETLVGGTVQPDPFLDIHERTTTDGERGLLSIAFDPDFSSNGLFYAYYTNNVGNIEVDEFHANSSTDADEQSRRQVIVVPHPGAGNHNGGTVAFGPDGYLYMATGDGGSAGDPNENAQNKTSLLGKMLRIDPHRAGGYRIPKGNPFAKRPGRNEIYALGLRNPFRYSFDALTGNVAIGDVGQDRFEEIDYETPKSLRGANFGWDHFEGDHRFNYPGDNEARRPRHNYQRPIHDYPHSMGNVITGGVVVRDQSLPTLYGRYVYSDFSRGDLRSLVPKLRGAQGDRALGLHIDNPSSFWSAADGTVYVSSLTDGVVYRLVASG